MAPAHRKRLTRQVRVKVALQLTQAEIERLEARAAGEIRPIGNYVAWVIERHLATKPTKASKPRDADPNEERTAYEAGVLLTIPERRELEKRAADERRSLSSYVTRLLVEELQQ